MCRYLQRQPLLLILILLLASGSDLNGTGTRRGITTDEKLDALLSQFAQFKEQMAQIPTLTNWMSRMDSHITKTLEDFATRLTEMEQKFSNLTARRCKVETYAASASNVSGSARSWPSAEQVDGSTAAGSRGPDHLMTTETQDEDLIRSQTPKMNRHEVLFNYNSLANNTTKGKQSGPITFGKDECAANRY